MCCTFGPSKLSDTITGTWEVMVDDAIHHVTWYQNTVNSVLDDDASYIEAAVNASVSRAQRGVDWRKSLLLDVDLDLINTELEWRMNGNPKRMWDGKQFSITNGNCLIIPLPGPWESIRLLNTIDMPNVLKDVHNALTPAYELGPGSPVFAGGNWGASTGDALSGRIAFLKFDKYDILLAEHASDFDKVLMQIEPSKRPMMNTQFFAAMQKLYSCPFALCCFSNLDSFTSNPIAFAYTPFNPEKLMVYTLDSHDGMAPNIESQVLVNHSIFAGSQFSNGKFGAPLTLEDRVPDHMKPYMVEGVVGLEIDYFLENGDFEFDVIDVRKGITRCARVRPNGARPQHAAPRIIERDTRYQFARQ